MTTFADPSTFPSVFETPGSDDSTTTAPESTPAAENAEATTVEASTSETATTPEAATVEAATAEATIAEAPVEVTPKSFADLGLPPEIVRVLTREGITTPFEIQAATMPDALAGRDVLGRGQTGSGKTLAFGLPLYCPQERPWHAS